MFLVAGSKNEWADFSLIFLGLAVSMGCVFVPVDGPSIEGFIASGVIVSRSSPLHMAGTLRYVQYVQRWILD